MRNALVVDLDRCSGCFSCEVACKMENGIALGSYYNKVLTVGPFGEFPKLSQYFLPVACQQCEDAPCVHVCPTGASYRDPDTNIVLVDKSKCIGCKYCMMACPYGVRSWNTDEKCVEKCTLCGHLTSNGELPACVHNCPGGARFYGDLDDPTSDASQAIAGLFYGVATGAAAHEPLLMWGLVVIVGGVAPALCGWVAAKQPASALVLYVVATAAAFIGCAALRCAMWATSTVVNNFFGML